ncbi:hypothetical protein QCA50_011673 [Cerrena zonata]|uniref:Uncharacterized protein n=1 Tax=Cerrena zonata TaxID=2478898 RepID=A0AAW0G2F4_9APHY
MLAVLSASVFALPVTNEALEARKCLILTEDGVPIDCGVHAGPGPVKPRPQSN